MEAACKHRWLAGGVFSAVLVLASAAAFLMPPVYRSEVLVVPAEGSQAKGGLSSLLDRFGGLAGLAGLNLAGSSGGQSQQAIELLKSRGFLAKFIQENNLLPVLFGSCWDEPAKQWICDPDDVPTIDDGVERFRRRVVHVDDRGSTIAIRIDWTDRELAAEWANLLVETLNERMRQRAIEESKRSLEYLDRQLTGTSTVEVRASIYRLVEEQLNKAMLASVRREFVFEVLDPAVPSDPDRPQRPRPALFLTIGVLAGGALAALAVALRAGLAKPDR